MGSIQARTGGNFALSHDGRFAYDPDSNGILNVIDISTPSAPVLAGQFDMSGLEGFGQSGSVLRHGNFLYVGGLAGQSVPQSAIDVFDIQNGTAPAFVGRHTLPSTTGPSLQGAWGNTLVVFPYADHMEFLSLHPSGSDRVVWDGRDGTGAEVAPGNYTYTVSAVDFAGNTSQASGAVVIPSPPTDLTPPAAVTDLTATPILSTGAASVALTWTAPGDDGSSGDIVGGRLYLRYSAVTSIYSEMAGQIFLSTDASPGQVRGVQIDEIERGVTYYFALQYADAGGNFADVSNLASTRTFEAQDSGFFAVTTTTTR